MRVLFDAKRYEERSDDTITDDDAVKELQFLDRTCDRVLEAMRSHIVWARVYMHEDQKFPVKGVRILEEQLDEQPLPGMIICSERLQVLLLEGWRTAQTIWTDEEVVEEVKGVH